MKGAYRSGVYSIQPTAITPSVSTVTWTQAEEAGQYF